MNATVKRAASAKTASKSNREETPAHDWLQAIDADAPCGVDLEYDAEFVVLIARVAAKMDVQYGEFVGAAEPINWSEVDRECRRLMMRTKDIRLAVLFTRCRSRLAGAGGLAEGLSLLAAWIDVYPETIHPQPGVDEDRDAALEIRMNALQALTDTEGLLSDVRDIALARAGVVRLQVRDIERAFAQPRASDALTVEAVTRHLEDLRAQPGDALAGFDAALTSLNEIEAWNHTHLGEYAADLSVLSRILRRLAGNGDKPKFSIATPVDESHAPDSPADVIAAQDERANAFELSLSQASATPESGVQTRSDGREGAVEAMRAARLWFEENEPSSPVPLMLRRAEFLVGKGYAEIVGAIPADLIEKWSTQK